MNYIELINRYWKGNNETPFSPTTTCVYFYLVHTCNSLGWKDPFRHSDRHIASMLNMSINTVRSAKNILKQRGLIHFKAGNSKGGRGLDSLTIYSLNIAMNDMYTDTLSDTYPDTFTDTLSDTYPDNNIKLNKTKLNKEDKSSISPVGDAHKVKPSFIIDEYNRICTNLRPVKLLTTKRSEMIMARLRQHGLENVIKMLELASKSSFLAGQSGNFSADLDWIMRPNNFVKVLEGKYNDKSSKTNNVNKPDKASPLEIIKQAYNHINAES